MFATRTVTTVETRTRANCNKASGPARACAGGTRHSVSTVSRRRELAFLPNRSGGGSCGSRRRRGGSRVTAALSSGDKQTDAKTDGDGDALGTLVKVLPVASLALLVGGGVAFKDPIVANLEIFSDYLSGMGPSGYVLYMAVYCGLELLAVPAIPLTMTAGALFGVIPGTIAASVAGTVAATGAFVAARYFLRQKVVDWAEQNPKFKAIDRAIADEGLKMVVLLRLSPLLPLSLSNYLYGLTSLELRPYVLGSWLGMLPGTFLYVQTGAVGMAVINNGNTELGSALPLLAGLGISCLTAFYVTKVASKAVAELDEQAERSL